MTRLIWGAPGKRVFETGVDRGVLFLPGAVGVPWDGLRAVREEPSGGSPQPYYLDGFKYANVATAEEFAATLEAFSSPPEFAVCDGSSQLAAGLFATQQPRKSFGLTYRTMIGDDLGGSEYKIHIVYNALAAPAGRENASMENSVTPTDLSWKITTRPPAAAFGYKPTAHFVIDSRYTPRGLLAYLEGILYGSDTMNSSLITQEELITLFTEPGPYVTTNLFTNPSFETTSGGVVEVLRNLALNPNAVAATGFTTNNGTIWTATRNVPVVANPQGITTACLSSRTGTASPATMSLYNIDSMGNAAIPARRIGAWFYTSAAGYQAQIRGNSVPSSVYTLLPAGVWTWVVSAVDVPANDYSLALVTKIDGSTADPSHQSYITGVTALPAGVIPKESIWGGRPAAGDFTYAWVGTANAAPSTRRGIGVASVLAGNAGAITSTEWFSSGSCSMRLMGIGANTLSIAYPLSTNAVLAGLLIPGKTYTIIAKCRLAAPQTGALETHARGIRYVGSMGGNIHVTAPNEAGVHELRLVFTVAPGETSGHIRLNNGAAAENGDVWWDDVLVVEGVYDGEYYDGSTPNTLDDRFSWSGPPHASTSIRESWNEYV